VILHNDIDMPFPKRARSRGRAAVPGTCSSAIRRPTVIWAHAGVGRIVQPGEGPAGDDGTPALASPQLKNFFIDISWSEMAKYVVATPETTAAMADLINRYPDRFLFGQTRSGRPTRGST